MDPLTIVFAIIIVIFSIMFHELAHGIAADKLGDNTARLAGRLTVNPIKHLEWVGSFIVPIICVLMGSGFIIGWAKPVPFNPSNLRNKRWGPAIVAAAGPLTNIAIAIIASIIIRLTFGAVPETFTGALIMVLGINIALAVFNMMPLPPLDGHHILGSIFPAYRRWSERFLAKYGILGLIIVIFLVAWFISPVIGFFIRILLP